MTALLDYSDDIIISISSIYISNIVYKHFILKILINISNIQILVAKPSDIKIPITETSS